MRFILLLAGTVMVAMGVTLYPSIYTIWIFVMTFPKYRYMRFIILLASTIMAAMGLTLYHGMHIHDMDFRCGVAKKSDSYMSFIILGWNHCGQNWIDSYHGMYMTWSFVVTSPKYRLR
jgi:hypothetical protein